MSVYLNYTAYNPESPPETTVSSTIFNVFIFLYRFINTSILAFESARFAIEILLLIIFIFQMYEYNLAFLAKLSSPFTYFKFSAKLQLCHLAMKDLVNSIYGSYLFMGQVGVVIFLWLTLKAINFSPIVFYVWFPCFAILMGVMIFVMIEILAATVFIRSNSLVQFWKYPISRDSGRQLISSSGYIKRRGRAQMPMQFSCGPFFVIGRATALLYTHIIFQNLATAVLLVDF